MLLSGVTSSVGSVLHPLSPFSYVCPFARPLEFKAIRSCPYKHPASPSLASFFCTPSLPLLKSFLSPLSVRSLYPHTMEAMAIDVNWCLACNCRTVRSHVLDRTLINLIPLVFAIQEGSSAYCSLECKAAHTSASTSVLPRAASQQPIITTTRTILSMILTTTQYHPFVLPQTRGSEKA